MAKRSARQMSATKSSSVRGARTAHNPTSTKPARTPIEQKLEYEERLWDNIKPGEMYELTEEDCKNVVPCHIFFFGARGMGRPLK